MLVQPLRVTHRSLRHPEHQHPHQQHSHHLDHDHDRLDTFQVHAIHWGGKQHGGDWRRWSQVSWKGIPLGHRSPLFIFLIRSVGTGTIPCSEHRGQQPLRLHGPEKPRASSPHAGPQRGKSPLYSSKPPTILDLTQKKFLWHHQNCPQVTHSVHYENFRCTKLQQMMSNLPTVRLLIINAKLVISHTRSAR